MSVISSKGGVGEIEIEVSKMKDLTLLKVTMGGLLILAQKAIAEHIACRKEGKCVIWEWATQIEKALMGVPDVPKVSITKPAEN